MAQIVQTTAVKGTCIICNCMPKDETKETHSYLPMFHAVGVDVNWGEDCNVCAICAGIMADMLGRMDAGKGAELEDQISELRQELEETQENFANYKEKVQHVLKGRKAQKELVNK